MGNDFRAEELARLLHDLVFQRCQIRVEGDAAYAAKRETMLCLWPVGLRVAALDMRCLDDPSAWGRSTGIRRQCTENCYAACVLRRRRVSRLSDVAPIATICSRPPVIMTFLRKWIIVF